MRALRRKAPLGALVLLAWACSAAPLAAGDALGGAATYLLSGAGARALGMGGAAVALVDDVNATVWNPAGLTRLGLYGTQVGSMTSFLSEERALNFLAVAQHVESVGDFGLSLQQFGIDKIDAFDSVGNPAGTFSDQELAVGLSYANLLGYQFRYGVTLRGLWQGLAESRALGWGGDLGIQYQPSLASDFVLGVVVQDPVAGLAWDSGRIDPVASNLKVGLADRYLERHLCVAADLDVPLNGDGQPRTHLGLELWLWQGLAARTGLDQKDLSAGASWSYEYYEVDYAWQLAQGQLGEQQQLSLILRF